MNRRSTKLSIATSVTSLVGLVSCNGGGGALPSFYDGWDYDKGSYSERERPLGAQDAPQNSNLPPDQLPDSTNDSPPNGGGGGGSGGGAFVCAGIYECVLTGQTRTCVSTNGGEEDCTPGKTVTVRVRIALQEKDGQCLIGEAVLEPNGTLRGDDEDEVGTWRRQGQNLIIEAGTSSGTCFPSSGAPGLVGDDGQTVETGSSNSGSGSTSDGNGNVSVDPGTGEQEPDP